MFPLDMMAILYMYPILIFIPTMIGIVVYILRKAGAING